MADPEKPKTPPPDDIPYYGDTVKNLKADDPASSPSNPPTSASNPPTASVTPPSAFQTPSSGGRTRGGTEVDVTPPEARLAMFDPSRRLNQYVLVLQVGQGGMGSVWKAWDTKLTRWVAVKFLNATHEESIRRFQREAQLAARLRHPNIAAIYEVNEHKGVHFLVMDFIDGTSIGKAGLTLDRAVEAFAKVCDAIEYAHKHTIIHRDIKPQNIMVTKDGEPFVTDFGLAKVLATESSISVSGAILGTPAYMPPEQASGETQSIDARSDIYSLGASLYMLAAGKPPFEAENATALLCKVVTAEPVSPRKVNPQCPAVLDAIILKAMEKDRAKRYQSAGSMGQDLRRYMNKQPVTARRPGAIGRNFKKIAASVLAMLLVGGAVIGGLMLLPEKDKGKGGSGGKSGGGPLTWADRYQDFQNRLKFDGFKTLSGEDLKDCRETLTAMSEEKAEEVAKWLEKQASDYIPAQVWPKPLWPEKKEEARRIMAWSRAVQGALQGLTMAVAGRFKGLQDRLDLGLKDFDPVVRHVESDVERVWRQKFDDLRLAFIFGTFKDLSPAAVKELNGVMKEMPDPQGDEAAAWFDRQITAGVPAQVWAKPLWGDKRAEAARIVSWSAATAGILEGTGDRHFKVIRERLAKAIKDFEPVTKYVETGGDRELKAKFDDLRLRLVFEGFKEPTPEGTRELNAVVKGLPDAMADEAASWFDRQIASNVPAQVWPKPLWTDKRAEAARIVSWCQAAGAVLEGADARRFKPIQDRLAKAAKDFEPVTKYVETGGDRELKAKFDDLRLRLVFEGFKEPTPEGTRELNAVVKGLPDAMADEAASWFDRQIASNVPAQVWPKPLWTDKRAEAARIVAWSAAAGAVLEGSSDRSFKIVRERLARAVKDFDPVAKYVESAGVEKGWSVRFDKVRELLILAVFKPLADPEAADLRKIMAETPESMADMVAQWFSGQADRIPPQAWPKVLWLTKQDEARFYVDWCKAAGALLESVPQALQARVEPARKKVQAAAARFAPVLAYRGRIVLRIYVMPHAALKSLQLGDRFVVKDGKKADADLGQVVGDDLGTPLVIEALDIGDITAVLALPGKGDHAIAINGQDLKNGEEHVLAGSAEDPATIKLRKTR